MKFELRDVEIQIFIGTTAAEISRQQKILVSIFFEFDTAAAEKSDKIGDTVDYQKIYDAVKKFSGQKFRLVEKLARRIFTAISQNFSVKNLRVEIQKFPFSDAKIFLKLEK